jgi:hypothetical protein
MIEIENRKHFNEVLFGLENVSDILKNIDQLCHSEHVNWEMLSNTIWKKAPEISPALNRWTALARCAAARHRTKTGNKSFIEWALAKNFITTEMIETAKSGKDIAPFSGKDTPEEIRLAEAKRVKKISKMAVHKGRLALATAEKIKKLNMPICPYCGKKAEDLTTHSCHKTGGKRKKHKSVWVISGGGANGIRNKR